MRETERAIERAIDKEREGERASQRERRRLTPGRPGGAAEAQQAAQYSWMLGHDGADPAAPLGRNSVGQVGRNRISPLAPNAHGCILL